MKSIKVDEYIHAELVSIKYTLGEANFSDVIKRLIRNWRVKKVK